METVKVCLENQNLKSDRCMYVRDLYSNRVIFIRRSRIPLFVALDGFSVNKESSRNSETQSLQLRPQITGIIGPRVYKVSVYYVYIHIDGTYVLYYVRVYARLLRESFIRSSRKENCIIKSHLAQKYRYRAFHLLPNNFTLTIMNGT